MSVPSLCRQQDSIVFLGQIGTFSFTLSLELLFHKETTRTALFYKEIATAASRGSFFFSVSISNEVSGKSQN